MNKIINSVKDIIAIPRTIRSMQEELEDLRHDVNMLEDDLRDKLDNNEYDFDEMVTSRDMEDFVTDAVEEQIARLAKEDLSDIEDIRLRLDTLTNKLKPECFE